MTRQNAWPSADRDALAVIDRFHWALPVGFYYKAGIKPKFAWPMIEPMIRKMAGLGVVDRDDAPRHLERVNWHPDVLVVGAGVAGLSAALAAAGDGRTVMLIDEVEPGARVAPGRRRTASTALLREVDAGDADHDVVEHARHRPVRGPAADRALRRRDLPHPPAGARDRLRRPSRSTACSRRTTCPA